MHHHGVRADCAGHAALQGFVGLQNLGNTCYLNATVQCLAALPELVACFHVAAQKGQEPAGPVSGAFRNLLQQLQQSYGGTVDPTA